MHYDKGRRKAAFVVLRPAKLFTMMRLLIPVALLAIASIAQAQQTDDAALRLLDRVTRQYEDADRLHLEATVTYTGHNDFTDSSQKSVLSAYVASGGRFRYHGQNLMGTGFLVSDGTSEWHLLESFRQYAKEPAGTLFGARTSMSGDDYSLVQAHDLIASFKYLGLGIQRAHFAPDQNLTFGGRTVQCKVIQYGSSDMARHTANESTETTLWIDPVSLTLLKRVDDSTSAAMYGMNASPFGRRMRNTTTTEFNLIDFDFELKADTFAFAAPPDTVEVAKLPVPYPTTNATATNQAASSPTSVQRLSLDHLGKPLPEITLVDANGKSFTLNRYAGHPLLIDVWATWCAPCIGELRSIDSLRRSTQSTDLKIIAIDEDDRTGTAAAALLKRRGYDWEDFHYDHAIAQALPTTGIPLMVLVDANGNVVYYHSGAGDAAGLAHAISNLGPNYAGATTNH